MFRTLLVYFALALPVAAQFDAATVLGTVHDPSGASIAAAGVTLLNRATSFSQMVSTSQAGEYQFTSVPIGEYTLAVSAPNMREAKAGPFTLTVGARQRVDFDLQLASAQTAVEVAATIRLVETESSDRGQVVRSTQVVELPLNGRAYSELVYLSTGVVPSPSAGQGFDSREGSFNANGLRSTFNNFLLDGVDNNYYGTSNQGFSNQVTQPPPDAVQEFRVVTNNMSAEYGRSGGATVNAAMRSGTNEFHGSLWEFFRNTELNAIGFFKPAGGEKPRLNRNQFGFAAGGPIRKNRTFFFADYEGNRQVNSFVDFATLPNTALRNGQLGVPLVNALAGALYANGVIPQTAITPFARAVLNALPPVTDEKSLANNFRTLHRVQAFRDKGDIKIDQNISDRIRGFARYDQSRADIFDPGTIPGLAGGDGNGNTRIPIIQAAGGLTWMLGSNSILEGRMGFSRSRSGKMPVLSGGPSMLEQFGIPGLPTDPKYTGGISYQLIPGFTSLGRQFTNPQYQYPTVWNPKLNWSMILGRHSVKAGAEYQRVHVEQEDIHPVYGAFAYQGGFSATGIPGVRADQMPLYYFADFLFGTPVLYGLASPTVANIREEMYFGYVQDDWRLLPNLTLNLGMRYEFATPVYERDNHLSNWNPATNQMDLAKNGSIADRALVDPDTNNFGPRAGLAWSVTPRTAIRTGYGVSYVHWNRVGSSYLTLNAPFAIVATALNIPGQPGFRVFQQGIPANFVNPQSYDKTQSAIQYMPRNSPTASVQNWFFSVQRELVPNLLIDLAYVGNTSNNLVLMNDLNQAIPNPVGQSLPSQYRRPNHTWGSVVGIMPWGFSNYNGMQVKLERRSSVGLYLLNSFTWSKAIDNGPQNLDGGSSTSGNDLPSVQNIYDLNAERGRSPYDRKIVNTTSLVYELPFGQGRRYLKSMPRAADSLLGGWQITAISSARSGAPVTPTYSPSTANEVSPLITISGRNQYRANVSANPLAPEGQRGPDFYLDRSKVSIPSAQQPFGNSGRNIVCGPAFWQVDLGVYKNLTFTDRLRAQFRAESFNAFNRTNFGTPDANISDAGFGTIRSTFDQRQFQFAVKLLF